MFGKIKPGGDHRDPPPSQQPHRPIVAPQASPYAHEGLTSIGSDITIVGKLVGKGIVELFGRIDGELHASDVMIGEGAHVEGNIYAQELTVGGHVKGTIHAVQVKLLGTAQVIGDVFHRSLSMDENAMFEGSSRREENPTGTPLDSPPAAVTSPFKAPVQEASMNGHEQFERTSDAFAP